jgi:hypothetical protein
MLPAPPFGSQFPTTACPAFPDLSKRNSTPRRLVAPHWASGAHFTAPEGTWFDLSDAIRAGKVLVYRVAPTTILGFGKGEQFSQTRWRFA